MSIWIPIDPDKPRPEGQRVVRIDTLSDMPDSDVYVTCEDGSVIILTDEDDADDDIRIRACPET